MRVDSMTGSQGASRNSEREFQRRRKAFAAGLVVLLALLLGLFWLATKEQRACRATMEQRYAAGAYEKVRERAGDAAAVYCSRMHDVP